MVDFFQNMDPYLRILWYIAIPVSLIFIFQMIMTFTGGDVADGVNADFDGDLAHGDAPFQLFSLRNLINFFLGFSWGGISFFDSISNKIALTILALSIGIAMLLVFFLIIKQIRKLSEDNSFNIQNTLAKTGVVYLTIPGNKSGKGKVQISVNGAIHELQAITHATDKLETGALVKVTSIIDNNLLVVEKI